MNEQFNHEVIFCIVNAGFSDAVMDAAREFGAKGGTVLHARGTANPEAEKLFNITVQPEKEISPAQAVHAALPLRNKNIPRGSSHGGCF